MESATKRAELWRWGVREEKRNIYITTNTTYFVIKKPTSGSVKASKTLPAKMMDDALMGEIPHT